MDRLDKMHELSGRLSISARNVTDGSVLCLGEHLKILDAIRKDYDREVIRLAKADQKGEK